MPLIAPDLQFGFYILLIPVRYIKYYYNVCYCNELYGTCSILTVLRGLLVYGLRDNLGRLSTQHDS